jgi:hypothetical protein
MLPQRFFFLLGFVFLSLLPSQAAVVRVEVKSREEVLKGQLFGTAGAYERITGKVWFSVAVTNTHNRRIVDLDNAVNLKNGAVEFSADFIAVQPTDLSKGNRTLILENPNRGHAGLISLVDGGDGDLSKSSGDAWLLRNGYSIVTLGWQWDAIGDDALKLYAPIAMADGRPITGLLRGDLMLSKTAEEIPLGHFMLGKLGGSEYPVAHPGDSRNSLTVRDSREARRKAIPRSKWDFSHKVNGNLQPSIRHLRLEGGFQPGKIYEYIYVVEDPVVAGLGFAALRDFAAYAKHFPDALVHASRVYGQGISQNGRYLRDFLFQGFNADEEGRIAMDGILAHVAGAGRGNFNYRFAQPSRDAQPTSAVDYPTDTFPFTDLPGNDPVTGFSGGLLDAAAGDHVIPKIFLSNTSYEYWGRAASLISTSVDGRRDVELSPQVRIYHFTGLQHFTGPYPAARGTGDMLGQEPESPLPVRYFWRSMIANMDAWVRDGISPPQSSYPKVSDQTLVPLKKYAFPRISGVNRPHEVSGVCRLDFGREWPLGITMQPPGHGKPFVVLIPQVDRDGNERDGVRLPEITVPLGTYTGWNLRDASIGAPGERLPFEGSYLSFSKTTAERKAMGDPRPSIEERYKGREDYMNRFNAAARDLVTQKWILAEDLAALIQRGTQEWEAAAK